MKKIHLYSSGIFTNYIESSSNTFVCSQENDTRYFFKPDDGNDIVFKITPQAAQFVPFRAFVADPLYFGDYIAGNPIQSVIAQAQNGGDFSATLTIPGGTLQIGRTYCLQIDFLEEAWAKAYISSLPWQSNDPYAANVTLDYSKDREDYYPTFILNAEQINNISNTFVFAVSSDGRTMRLQANNVFSAEIVNLATGNIIKSGSSTVDSEFGKEGQFVLSKGIYGIQNITVHGSSNISSTRFVLQGHDTIISPEQQAALYNQGNSYGCGFSSEQPLLISADPSGGYSAEFSNIGNSCYSIGILDENMNSIATLDVSASSSTFSFPPSATGYFLAVPQGFSKIEETAKLNIAIINGAFDFDISWRYPNMMPAVQDPDVDFYLPISANGDLTFVNKELSKLRDRFPNEEFELTFENVPIEKSRKSEPLWQYFKSMPENPYRQVIQYFRGSFKSYREAVSNYYLSFGNFPEFYFNVNQINYFFQYLWTRSTEDGFGNSRKYEALRLDIHDFILKGKIFWQDRWYNCYDLEGNSSGDNFLITVYGRSIEFDIDGGWINCTTAYASEGQIGKLAFPNFNDWNGNFGAYRIFAAGACFGQDLITCNFWSGDGASQYQNSNKVVIDGNTLHPFPRVKFKGTCWPNYFICKNIPEVEFEFLGNISGFPFGNKVWLLEHIRKLKISGGKNYGFYQTSFQQNYMLLQSVESIDVEAGCKFPYFGSLDIRENTDAETIINFNNWNTPGFQTIQIHNQQVVKLDGLNIPYSNPSANRKIVKFQSCARVSLSNFNTDENIVFDVRNCSFFNISECPKTNLQLMNAEYAEIFRSGVACIDRVKYLHLIEAYLGNVLYNLNNYEGPGNYRYNSNGKIEADTCIVENCEIRRLSENYPICGPSENYFFPNGSYQYMYLNFNCAESLRIQGLRANLGCMVSYPMCIKFWTRSGYSSYNSFSAVLQDLYIPNGTLEFLGLTSNYPGLGQPNSVSSSFAGGTYNYEEGNIKSGVYDIKNVDCAYFKLMEGQYKTKVFANFTNCNFTDSLEIQIAGKLKLENCNVSNFQISKVIGAADVRNCSFGSFTNQNYITGAFKIKKSAFNQLNLGSIGSILMDDSQVNYNLKLDKTLDLKMMNSKILGAFEVSQIGGVDVFSSEFARFRISESTGGIKFQNSNMPDLYINRIWGKGSTLFKNCQIGSVRLGETSNTKGAIDWRGGESGKFETYEADVIEIMPQGWHKNYTVVDSCQVGHIYFNRPGGMHFSESEIGSMWLGEISGDLIMKNCVLSNPEKWNNILNTVNFNIYDAWNNIIGNGDPRNISNYSINRCIGSMILEDLDIRDSRWFYTMNNAGVGTNLILRNCSYKGGWNINLFNGGRCGAGENYNTSIVIDNVDMKGFYLQNFSGTLDINCPEAEITQNFIVLDSNFNNSVFCKFKAFKSNNFYIVARAEDPNSLSSSNMSYNGRPSQQIQRWFFDVEDWQVDSSSAPAISGEAVKLQENGFFEIRSRNKGWFKGSSYRFMANKMILKNIDIQQFANISAESVLLENCELQSGARFVPTEVSWSNPVPGPWWYSDYFAYGSNYNSNYPNQFNSARVVLLDSCVINNFTWLETHTNFNARNSKFNSMTLNMNADSSLSEFKNCEIKTFTQGCYKGILKITKNSVVGNIGSWPMDFTCIDSKISGYSQGNLSNLRARWMNCDIEFLDSPVGSLNFGILNGHTFEMIKCRLKGVGKLLFMGSQGAIVNRCHIEFRTDSDYENGNTTNYDPEFYFANAVFVDNVDHFVFSENHISLPKDYKNFLAIASHTRVLDGENDSLMANVSRSGAGLYSPGGFTEIKRFFSKAFIFNNIVNYRSKFTNALMVCDHREALWTAGPYSYMQGIYPQNEFLYSNLWETVKSSANNVLYYDPDSFTSWPEFSGPIFDQFGLENIKAVRNLAKKLVSRTDNQKLKGLEIIYNNL